MAEALVALVNEGDPSPTAKSVAERADVSVRLVFHHFEDMNALHVAAMDVQEEQSWSRVREVMPGLPLDKRIEQTVQQRAKLFDAIAPLRRLQASLAAQAPNVAIGLARSDLLLRDWLATTFSPELDGAAQLRRTTLDAIDAAASWETWDRLRRRQHLSGAAARRVMCHTLERLLAT